MSEIYFVNISASFFVSLGIFVYPAILSVSVHFLFPDQYCSSMFIISDSIFHGTHGNNPCEYPSSGISLTCWVICLVGTIGRVTEILAESHPEYFTYCGKWDQQQCEQNITRNKNVHKWTQNNTGNVPHLNVQQSTYITQNNMKNVPQVSLCHSEILCSLQSCPSVYGAYFPTVLHVHYIWVQFLRYPW
jgi:hypothetical protein